MRPRPSMIPLRLVVLLPVPASRCFVITVGCIQETFHPGKTKWVCKIRAEVVTIPADHVLTTLLIIPYRKLKRTLRCQATTSAISSQTLHKPSSNKKRAYFREQAPEQITPKLTRLRVGTTWISSLRTILCRTATRLKGSATHKIAPIAQASPKRPQGSGRCRRRSTLNYLKLISWTTLASPSEWTSTWSKRKAVSI